MWCDPSARPTGAAASTQLGRNCDAKPGPKQLARPLVRSGDMNKGDAKGVGGWSRAAIITTNAGDAGLTKDKGIEGKDTNFVH